MFLRLVPAVLFSLVVAYSSVYALKFIAYGDSRGGMTTPNLQAPLFEAEAPGLICFTGDFRDATTQSNFTSEWCAPYRSRTILNNLLTNGKVCAAHGNHDGGENNETFLPGLTPNVTRGSTTTHYSYTEGNCFFVCMGYDPGTNGGHLAWLRTQLASAASQAAAWRFVYAHKPIYSSYGGLSGSNGHGANGTTSEGSTVTLFRQYCDTFHVTATFAGHDHGYERTKLLKANAAVSNTSPFNPDNGTVYMMNGGGGAPFYTYSTTAPAWSGFRQNVNGWTVIDAKTDTCYFTTKNNTGAIVDQFKFVKPTSTAVKPDQGSALPMVAALTFTSSRLRFGVPVEGHVALNIYNMKGELVSTLVNKTMAAGIYTLPVSRITGTYLCVLEANGTKVSQKIIVK